MRIMLVSLLLLALPLWSALAMDEASGGDDAAMTASAGDYEAGCLSVPNGCSIDCVGIELACCKNPCECPEGKEATLRVEFMGEDGAVLATGNVTNNWCNPCRECRTGPLATFGQLDNAIDPCAIKTARISAVDGPEGGINVKTLVLWVRDPQGRLGVCEKWYKAYKCSPECCQILGGGTSWTFTSNGCCKQSCGTCNKCASKCDSGCDKCSSNKSCGSCNKCAKPKCGCNKCESKCNSCNKCGEKKCGCDKCAKPKCDSGCNKCSSNKSCGSCNKCAKPKCGCNKCESKCSSCNKCGEKKCGCDKCAKPACDKCAKPKCGCNKCESKCNSCNKCGEKKCGCDKCAKPACDKCGKTSCSCSKPKCGCGKCGH